MKRALGVISLASLVAVTLIQAAAQQPSGYDVLQQALAKERAAGQLEEAIALYRQIVRDHAANRPLMAKALVQLGRCYEKLGRAEARKTYERVVREFAEQADMVAEANLRLATLAGGSPDARSSGASARPVWTETGGNDVWGSVSPDGRYLSFVDWETGDLAVRDLQTNKTRRLTGKGSWNASTEMAQWSAISPDGSRIAYAWINKEQFSELRLIGLDGRQPRLLYRNEQVRAVGPFSWAAGGKELVAVFERQDRTTQLVIVSVADGSTRVLKSFDWRRPGPLFAPDGRYIAYSFPPIDDRPEHDIFLIAKDGSREVPLITHTANDFALAWSPDGSRLLFGSDRTGMNSVWGIRVSGGQARGEPELLTPDIGRFVGGLGLTTKGDYYYTLNTGAQDVYAATMDPATGRILEAPTPLRGGRFYGGKSEAAWSPDGERLAYISTTPQQGSAAGGILSIHTLKTGEVRDIPLKVRYAGAPIWFPDGRALIVWGPDLRGRTGFYRVDLSTGTLERTTPGPGSDTPPRRWASLSPDGRALFYWVIGSDGVRVQTRAVRGVRRQDLATGEDREIDADGVTTFDLSPDGRWLAVRRGPPHAGIYVMPASGGEARPIFRPAEGEQLPFRHTLTWTRDGRFLLFTRFTKRSESGAAGFTELGESYDVWRVPVDGGAAEKLEVALPGINRISVHPDGRRLAISAGSAKFEAWVLENLVPPVSTKAVSRR